MSTYRPRLLDSTLREVMGGLPAAMIVGPRGAGKTTSARRHAATTIRLDRPIDADPVRGDPDAVLAATDRPVLLDEWQMVPEVLGAVKRSIDDDARPGQFILTGSVRAELLTASWAATGRVVRLTQWPMCQRELVGDVTEPSFFDRILGGDDFSAPAPNVTPDVRGYIDLALRGGLPPLALQTSDRVRRRWLDGYIDQLLTRDAELADESRDPVKLRRYLAACATNTAGVVEHKLLYDAAGVVRPTGSAYDSLLELLFVTEQIPAFHSNRLKRLVKNSKRYIVEPALLGPLLNIDSRSALRNGDVLGRLIDTFVVSQLRPEVEASESRPRLFHLRRDDGGREVDLIVEYPDGRVAGIEIKSSSAPKPDDGRHLMWLRSQLGDRVVATIVFHTGPRPYRLGDDVIALPIACLWG